MVYIYLLGCLIFMLTQAFFCAGEISFISIRPLKLRHRQIRGDKKAAKIYRLVLEPEKFFATTLAGINISLVLSSSFFTFLLMRLGVKNSNLWAMIIFTPLVVIFAELIPKNIGRLFKEDFSYRAAPIIAFFEKLFFPLVKVINLINKFFVKNFIRERKRLASVITKDELKSMIKEFQKEGGLDRGETEAIEDVFDFKIDRIKDVCVGLRKLVGLDYTDSYDKILEIARKKGFTRYPVFRNKEITGYINIYDLFYNPGKTWHSFIRPIMKVGSNQKLYEVFSRLKAKKESIALVIKGAKAYGIITLEDLTWEIITSIVKI